MLRSSILAALAGLSARALGQIANICPMSNVCFGLNIPASTAATGQGDIFFQISAPTSFQWVALGQGSGMSNANYFIVYTSANGKNVTLSPRGPANHVEPKFSDAAQVTLLEGSGVVNGKMVANVKCSNCQSWNGGKSKMNFMANSATWIYAVRTGSPLNTNDQAVTLTQHNAGSSGFSWNMAKAMGGNSANPFLASTTNPTSPTKSNTGGTATSCVPRPTSTGKHNDDGNGYKRAENVNYCDDDSNSNTDASNGDFTPISTGPTKTMLMAHGIMAALAFVVFFPFGAISIRVFSFPGTIWFHAAFQVAVYLLYVVAFGIGVYIATQLNYLNAYHPIIGIIVFVMLFFQPILGMLHHSAFKKIGGRSAWSYAHLWIGRTMITLGIINGGLGLQLANNATTGNKITYAAVAAIIWVIWVVAAVFGEIKRAKSPAKYTSPAGSQRGFGGDDSHEFQRLSPKRN